MGGCDAFDHAWFLTCAGASGAIHILQEHIYNGRQEYVYIIQFYFTQIHNRLSQEYIVIFKENATEEQINEVADEVHESGTLFTIEVHSGLD